MELRRVNVSTNFGPSHLKLFFPFHMQVSSLIRLMGHKNWHYNSIKQKEILSVTPSSGHITSFLLFLADLWTKLSVWKRTIFWDATPFTFLPWLADILSPREELAPVIGLLGISWPCSVECQCYMQLSSINSPSESLILQGAESPKTPLMELYRIPFTSGVA